MESLPSNTELRRRSRRGHSSETAAQQFHCWHAWPRLNRLNFDRCPICLDLDASTDEHVPPFSVGGAILTSTCHACNSGLGATVDAEYNRWFKSKDPTARISVDGVRGQRRLRGGVSLITGNDGGLVIAIANPDSDITAALRSGDLDSFSLHLRDAAMPLLGLLKSAYLGVCVLLQAIPSGPTADEIRNDLLRARDREINSDAESRAASHLSRLSGRGGQLSGVRYFAFDDPHAGLRSGIALGSVVAYGGVLDELLPAPNAADIPSAEISSEHCLATSETDA